MACRLVALLACLVPAAAACGVRDRPMAAECTQSAAAIERALQHAPAAVRLAGGTPLSDCVTNARTDAELQSLGIVVVDAAERLAQRGRHGDARAALQLGYLVGAARRGAARTSGIQAELARRIARAASFLDERGPQVAAALRRGMGAGETSG